MSKHLFLKIVFTTKLNFNKTLKCTVFTVTEIYGKFSALNVTLYYTREGTTGHYDNTYKDFSYKDFTHDDIYNNIITCSITYNGIYL